MYGSRMPNASRPRRVGPKRTLEDEVFDPHPAEVAQRECLHNSYHYQSVASRVNRALSPNICRHASSRTLTTAPAGRDTHPSAPHTSHGRADHVYRRTALGCHFLPNDAGRLQPLCPTRNGRVRVYNASWSASGAVLLVSAQDETLSLYGHAGIGQGEGRAMWTTQARDVAWTVTSVDISPDETSFLYSSMQEVVHVVRLPAVHSSTQGEGEEGAMGEDEGDMEEEQAWGEYEEPPFDVSTGTYARAGTGGTGGRTAGRGDRHGVARMASCTSPGRIAMASGTCSSSSSSASSLPRHRSGGRQPQLQHERLDLSTTPSSHGAAEGGGGGPRGRRYGGGFGVYSCKWSKGGSEIVAGCSNRSLIVYDVATRSVTDVVADAHADDINSVTFAGSGAYSDTLVSASDDRLIKVWDRRTLGAGGSGGGGWAEAGRVLGGAVGVLPGHTEGITHVCAKGDGRTIASNGKDQCVKLWDLRKGLLTSKSDIADAARQAPARTGFDYRWQSYPIMEGGRHPCDRSFATLRGHAVLETLIRVGFSPEHSTGGRYVYSGSACGRVFLWDSLTGELHAVLGRLGERAGLYWVGGSSVKGGAQEVCMAVDDPAWGTPAANAFAAGAINGACDTASGPYVHGNLRGGVREVLCRSSTPDYSDNKHGGTVRDVAWHPYEPLLATASFDGSVGLWTHSTGAWRLHAEQRENRRVWREALRTRNAAARQALQDMREGRAAGEDAEQTDPAPAPAAPAGVDAGAQAGVRRSARLAALAGPPPLSSLISPVGTGLCTEAGDGGPARYRARDALRDVDQEEEEDEEEDEDEDDDDGEEEGEEDMEDEAEAVSAAGAADAMRARVALLMQQLGIVGGMEDMLADMPGMRELMELDQEEQEEEDAS